MLLILTSVLLILYILLLVYYRKGWKAIQLFRPQVSEVKSLFISVIVPARNEALRIPRLLDSLKSQGYPAALFEVIVVDDFSADQTAGIVTDYPMQNLFLLSLQDFVDTPINSYKKKALEQGIARAKGTLIVTTDADCFVPATWLQYIAACYHQYQPQMIVMPVWMEHISSLELFQSLDFMTMQGITGASLQLNAHSMCNGANLAYCKTAFNEVGGFAGIDHLASGDDMLLMQKISDRYPGKISYLKAAEVIVRTPAMHTLNTFINQRVRWASKSRSYPDFRITIVLALVYALNLSLCFYPFTFLNGGGNIKFWLLALVAKTVVELYFLIPVARFFNKEKDLYFFPLFEPFHIMYIVTAGWLGLSGSYKWKGRKVK